MGGRSSQLRVFQESFLSLWRGFPHETFRLPKICGILPCERVGLTKFREKKNSLITGPWTVRVDGIAVGYHIIFLQFPGLFVNCSRLKEFRDAPGLFVNCSRLKEFRDAPDFCVKVVHYCGPYCSKNNKKPKRKNLPWHTFPKDLTGQTAEGEGVQQDHCARNARHGSSMLWTWHSL